MSSEWIETLVEVLLNTSFRAVALAGCVALLLWLNRVRSAALRHAVWSAVLLSMLLMPALMQIMPSVPVTVRDPAAFIHMSRSTASASPSEIVPGRLRAGFSQQVQGASPSAAQPMPVWPAAAAILYFVVGAGLLGRVLYGWKSVSRMMRHCRPVDRKDLDDARAADVSLWESANVSAPVTVGIFSPRIILPPAWRTWTPCKLRAVLAHECSHVRRRDTLVALLAMLNRCLFWFHPLAWWLERKLAATAELACDEDAWRAVGGQGVYAEVLLEMARDVRRRGGRVTLPGIAGGNGFIHQRIEQILSGKSCSKMAPWRSTVLLAGCALAVILVAGCREKSAGSRIEDNPDARGQQSRMISLWAKRLRIVTDPVNTPFVFGEGTGVQGLDVDIGNRIARKLGMQVHWAKAPNPGFKQNRLRLVVDELFGRSPRRVLMNDYDHLFELLKEGEADLLVSAIVIDSGRNKEFAFSIPYYETGDIIAHQRNRSDIASLENLSGKRVGVAAGRPGDSFMARQRAAESVRIVRYSSIDDAMGALNRLEIDAVVGDEPLIAYGAASSYHNTATLPIMVNRYSYAVAVNKDKSELLANINRTLEEMKSSGELTRLDKKWMRRQEASLPSSALLK